MFWLPDLWSVWTSQSFSKSETVGAQSDKTIVSFLQQSGTRWQSSYWHFLFAVYRGCVQLTHCQAKSGQIFYNWARIHNGVLKLHQFKSNMCMRQWHPGERKVPRWLMVQRRGAWVKREEKKTSERERGGKREEETQWEKQKQNQQKLEKGIVYHRFTVVFMNSEYLGLLDSLRHRPTHKAGIDNRCYGWTNCRI